MNVGFSHSQVRHPRLGHRSFLGRQNLTRGKLGSGGEIQVNEGFFMQKHM